MAGVADVSDNDTCVALVAGSVRCFGFGDDGQLGDGYQPTGHYPVQPVPGAAAGFGDVSGPTPLLRFAPGDVTVTPAVAFRSQRSVARRTR